MKSLINTGPIEASQGILRTAWPVLAVNLIIAALLTLLSPNDTLGRNLISSNAIGFSVWGIVVLIRRASRLRVPRRHAMIIAIPLGVLLGSAIAALLGAHNPLSAILSDPVHHWRHMAVSLLITVSAVIFFTIYFRAAEYRSELETQSRQAAEARQSETTARLALLQAQIEPHFLFNTLANVQSMIERDPPTATIMLDHLNRYLRATLGRTRNPSSTCANEIELIEALLAIAAIRLGARLKYRIDIPHELRSARLPPLLLQPLVENALKHGIEPAIAGGEIRVEGDRDGDTLLLRVRDTGIGFTSAAPEGVGLSNVRARLASLYADKGRLTLHKNEPAGVIAELRLPLQWN